MYILNGDENSNILSIEFTNEEMDMCDITIDSDEHSYYINGIETHNCSQEALLLALLSKDNKMIQNFKDGIDPHTATAYGIWGRENYSKGLRKLAKACLGEDSYILTKRGLIRPSDLNRDDKIIDKNGNEQNYLLEKDYGDLIRVEYDTGIVEEYTPNHKLYVWTGKDFIWKEVQEVTSEDNIVQVTNFKYEVGGVDRIVDITPKKVYNKNYKINTSCKEFSYLMGLYLGDGYIDIKKNLAGDTYGGFISWVVSDEALDKVKSYIDFLGLGHSSSFKVGKNKIANVIKVFHSHFAFYIKDTFGTCKNKNIPDWVFKTWNKQTIKYFIAGLIDSDGSKRSCSLVFSNTNINIINKLASLCAIVGIKTKIKNRYTKYKGERYSFYELSLYDIQEKLPLLNSYKQVCGTGATRLGSWEIDKNYYKEEIHYKKITFKKYPDKIKDGSQNIISGRSRLTSNLIRMFEEYNIEIPIDSSMQMAKIRNKNYKKGNIYVIQTDNHEYISNCTVSHNCNFAINYGGNFRTIAKNAEIPIDQAKEIYEAYEEAFFESVQWKQNEISKMWKSGGTAYTIFGRPRRFGSYVKMAEKIIQEAEDPLKGERESDNLVSAAERRVASHQIQGCLQKHVRILTDRGYITIRELYEEDLRNNITNYKVWTGSKWAAFNVVNRGKAQLAKLFLKGGTVLDCDTRHEIYTHTGRGNVVLKKVTDLNHRRHQVAFQRTEPFDFPPILPEKWVSEKRTGNTRQITIESNIHKDMWYWIGYWVGDGSWSGKDFDYPDKHRKCIHYTFGRHEEAKAEECISFFKTMKLNPVKRYKVNNIGGKSITVTISSAGWIDFMTDVVGIEPLCKFNSKKVPDILFRSPLEHRLYFIDGLFDSDGSKKYGRLHMKNYELLYQVKQLCDISGIPSRLNSPDTRKCGTTNLSLGGKYKGLKEQWGAKGLDDRYSYRSFDKLISLDKYEDTYTLVVHDEDHRFVSDGVISKNTAGDICRYVLLKLYENIFKYPEKERECSFLSTVHDEMNFYVDTNKILDYTRIIEDIMRFELPQWPLPITTTIGLGWRWGSVFDFVWTSKDRTELVPKKL